MFSRKTPVRGQLVDQLWQLLAETRDQFIARHSAVCHKRLNLIFSKRLRQIIRRDLLVRPSADPRLSNVAQSWVDNGPNKEISPEDLSKALGADQIKTLMAQSGLPRDELIAGLSQQLPELVNQLTPNGRLPTEHEASRLI